MNSSQTRLDEFKQRSSITEWEIVSVTFDNADVDVEVKTKLFPADPELIEYQVLNASGPALVFHDTSASRIKWSAGLIRLRSAVAGLKATLLLTVLAEDRQKLDGGSKVIASSFLPPSGGESTVTTTGTINDLAIGSSSILRMNNATEATINGLVAGTPGQVVAIVSVGAGDVLLAHQNTGSVAANRLINVVTSDVTPLAAGKGAAIFQYDSTTARWRLVSHSQGAPILVPYATGDYTANGSMTWTGSNADPSFFDYKYIVEGAKLTITLGLDAGTIGGTVNIQCQLKLPRGYTAAGQAANFAFIKNNGVREHGRFLVSSGGTNINITKIDQSNFTLQTGSLQIFGELFLSLN